MVHYADPPVLLRDVLDDPRDAVALLERNAPYTPLGGWYRPDSDGDDPTSPMWFQKDWVHADLQVQGSELFLQHGLTLRLPVSRFAPATGGFDPAILAVTVNQATGAVVPRFELP